MNDIDEPIEFPYEDYDIIGDTSEIDKILNTCGRINLDAADVRSSLSKTAPNYVVTGSGEGDNAVDDAFRNALSKLPVKTDDISKMLLNIWIAPDYKMASASTLPDCITPLDKSIDICWGNAVDDSLTGQQTKITLLASIKVAGPDMPTCSVNCKNPPTPLQFQGLIKLLDDDDEGDCD